MTQERETKPRCPMCGCVMEKRNVPNASADTPTYLQFMWWCNPCGDGFSAGDRLAPDDDFAETLRS